MRFSNMKKGGLTFLIASLIFFFACNHNKNIPDVSGIPVEIKIERFDKDFFSIDSNAVESSLPPLEKKYPVLLPIFLQNVLGIADSSGPYRTAEIKKYLSQNRPIYDSILVEFKDMNDTKNELEQAFKYVKYYFSSYKVPGVATVAGPIDLLAQMKNGDYTPDFLGPDFLAISLQFYLGRDFSIYQNEFFISNIAPSYRSRRFEKEYIVPDAMKLIVDDLFPEKSTAKPLIEQMIEKGKQWYLLDHFLPRTADSLKTGYTQKQLGWCTENEGLIWGYIIQNENLYSIEPTVLQNYLGESPYTQGMPESSPGNIGQWVGWQIVKKFAEKNPALQPGEVMRTEYKKILEGAKYKPK